MHHYLRSVAIKRVFLLSLQKTAYYGLPIELFDRTRYLPALLIITFLPLPPAGLHSDQLLYEWSPQMPSLKWKLGDLISNAAFVEHSREDRREIRPIRGSIFPNRVTWPVKVSTRIWILHRDILTEEYNHNTILLNDDCIIAFLSENRTLTNKYNRILSIFK